MTTVHRARLDALYFHLYGLSKEDAAYILDTFPIVRRHDEAAFGRYRTKEMTLAYYNALAAGDTDVEVAVYELVFIPPMMSKLSPAHIVRLAPLEVAMGHPFPIT